MLALTRLERLLSLGLILLGVLVKLKIDLGRITNIVDLVINLNGWAIVEGVAVLRWRLLAANKKILTPGADIAMRVSWARDGRLHSSQGGHFWPVPPTLDLVLDFDVLVEL